MRNERFISTHIAVSICITITLAISVFGRQTSAAQTPDNRPNILFAIADDWSWPHAGIYGDKINKTPVFDRIASQGVLFTHAFCAAPTCMPSRGAILTGQAIHRLEEGGNLHSFLPNKFKVYPDLLEAAGYFVGYMEKGWAPGKHQLGGWKRNPAGPVFKGFKQFLKQLPQGRPFCFWFGSRDPHRHYKKGSGQNAGMKIADVAVPPFLPDTPEVRSDILDYYFEVQRFDRRVGEMLNLLDEKGLADNTLVVMTSDNGMPFPRAKADLYDSGCRMPLAVRWPARIKPNRRIDDFISFTDFAPTFLQAAGLQPLPEMTGRSFLDLLVGSKSQVDRNEVFLGRERHDYCRKSNLSYPMRAIRTRKFLYIRNLKPDRWPAGDPQLKMVSRQRNKVTEAVRAFGEVDDSPSKDVLMAGKDDPKMAGLFKLAFDKRPSEELYNLSKDPHQLNNVAGRPEYAAVKKQLRTRLDNWLRQTQDPRILGKEHPFETSPYFGRWKEVE